MNTTSTRVGHFVSRDGGVGGEVSEVSRRCLVVSRGGVPERRGGVAEVTRRCLVVSRVEGVKRV